MAFTSLTLLSASGEELAAARGGVEHTPNFVAAGFILQGPSCLMSLVCELRCD
jgi:hypothetical protein